jgi:hypothetical protein
MVAMSMKKLAIRAHSGAAKASGNGVVERHIIAIFEEQSTLKADTPLSF